jgi:hypothetical protein
MVGVKRLEKGCKVIDANMTLFQLHLVELLKVLKVLTPNGTGFKLFLNILEESQGGLLRQFSSAADKIVRHLIYEDMNHPEPFHLEVVEAKEILEHPKGSPGLRRMLN